MTIISFAIAVLLFSNSGALDLEYPLGDVRNCGGAVQGRGSVTARVDVLPGLGFDNLRNLDLGQVLAYNYSTCQVSGDGSYLMPDGVRLVPVQESKVDTFAEYFSTFHDYTSHTAASINFQAKYSGMFSSASGSFSADFQSTKSTMWKHNSNSARVSLRYKFYTAHIASDAQLHFAFKSRLLDIAASVQNNNTKLAHYLAETLVRDYGTHVITSIDAGAGLSKTTFVSRKFLQHKSEGERSLAISENAGSGFLFWRSSESLDVSYSHYHQYKDQFSYNTTNSHIFSYGGPMYRVGNFSLTDWENGVLDHLVAIDRSGVPLYSVISTNNVPELPDSTLLTVMDYVYKAVTKYYKVNTIAGCTNSSSPKFNFQANVDDGSCEEEKKAHFFGGMYQTCTAKTSLEKLLFCNDFRQANPVTQDYNCRPGYEPILLYINEGSKYEVVHVCKKHCTFLGLSCRDNCWTYQKLHLVTYHTYWCAQQQNSTKDVGVMFGGVYTLSQQNPLTGSRTCPPYFYSLRFGEDIWVCVSDDPQGAKYSVPFGGFHSCSNGNPLVSTKGQLQKGIYPHRCGKHYHQFLITIDEGCEIYFCADVATIMKQQPHPPRLPPYHALPRMSHNVTNTLVVKGNNGRVWIKNEDGAWIRYRDGQQTSKEYLMSLAREAAAAGPSPSDDNMDNDGTGSIGIMIGVVIGSVAGTVIFGALIALLVFGLRKASKSKRLLRSGNNSSKADYLAINDEGNATAHHSHGSTDSAV